jgi:hypothetical protein
MELPQAIRIAMRSGRPIMWPIKKLMPSAIATTEAMPTRRNGPSARTVATLTDAPSMTTAHSSRNFALNVIPGIKRGVGIPAVRTATPTRIASTSASR